MISLGIFELCFLVDARAYESTSEALDEDDSTDFGLGIAVGDKSKGFIGGGRLVDSPSFCRFDADRWTLDGRLPKISLILSSRSTSSIGEIGRTRDEPSATYGLLLNRELFFSGVTMLVKFEWCRACLLVAWRFGALAKSELFISGVSARKKRRGSSPSSESAPMVETISRRSLRIGLIAGVGVPVGVEEFDPSSLGPLGVDGHAREEGLAVVVSSALLSGRNSRALLEGRLPFLSEGRASALLAGRYQHNQYLWSQS